VHGALLTPTPGIIENGVTFVVFGTVAFSVVMSILFLVTRGSDSMYDQIGAGGLSRESDYSGGGVAPLSAPGGDRAEQEQEVRQMLAARNERLVRRGESPLDVEAEVRRLMAEIDVPKEHDAALLAEVRQMVLARNERRARQGLPGLDVEEEVARTLAELDP
jgi:hypothetical protein